MNTNKKAIFVLFVLVSTSVLIFCAERKFLVAEKRGSALSRYEKIPWAGKIRLLVDDIEGLPDSAALAKEKFFAYGSAKINIDMQHQDKSLLAGTSALKVGWNGSQPYGGWGKGIGENIDLDAENDFLNFRIYVPKKNGETEFLKIILEEDDNDDGKLQQDKDDQWAATLTLPAKDEWQLISVPLKDFADDNEGGDHLFNVSRRGGLHTIIFSLQQPDKYTRNHVWFFDFIFFSSGKIEDTPMFNILN